LYLDLVNIEKAWLSDYAEFGTKFQSFGVAVA